MIISEFLIFVVAFSKFHFYLSFFKKISKSTVCAEILTLVGLQKSVYRPPSLEEAVS